MNLSVSGLSATRSGRTILHPTSLDIAQCEYIALVGASGSGKSTLGHVLIDNLRSRGLRVAHVPQCPEEALDPLRSMRFHWHETERALGFDPGSTDKKTLFTALKIQDGDLQKRPWAWSRGMQQRFVIAMALISAPDLIVLDEPTSALDPIIAAATMDLLGQYRKGHDTAMILITHDLGLAARHASTLIVMHNGRIVEKASTVEVLKHPQTDAAKSLVAHRIWAAMPC
ncbi:MAG: ATP-binding cassette domain-containing protein [Rhodobacteraceae bacterium]|nr:ATP-binding cassette domain-containing protein [Paracoccaceae bacterium]